MISPELRDQIALLVSRDGRSQNKIAQAINIDQGLLSKAMRGEKGLSIENIEKLVSELGGRLVVSVSHNDRINISSQYLIEEQVVLIERLCLALARAPRDPSIMEDLEVAVRLLERAADRVLKARAAA